jgi:hypothetical protein
MKEDFFQKAKKDAERRLKIMRFIKWAEENQPTQLNNLREAYRRYKEDLE